MSKAGDRIAKNLARTKRHGGELLAPQVFEGDGSRALPLVRQRARASFIHRINVIEKIADGDYHQQVTTTGPDGKKTVTCYTPSAKDRMQALRMLAEYGHVPTGASQGGGGPLDLGQLTVALVGAMRDPGVRAMLLGDPELRDTVRLLGAEDVTAYTMPGPAEQEAVDCWVAEESPGDRGTGEAQGDGAEGPEGGSAGDPLGPLAP